jgi:hypothetical protein
LNGVLDVKITVGGTASGTSRTTVSCAASPSGDADGSLLAFAVVAATIAIGGRRRSRR